MGKIQDVSEKNSHNKIKTDYPLIENKNMDIIAVKEK